MSGCGVVLPSRYFIFVGKPRSKMKKDAAWKRRFFRREWVRLLGEHDRHSWLLAARRPSPAPTDSPPTSVSEGKK